MATIDKTGGAVTLSGADGVAMTPTEAMALADEIVAAALFAEANPYNSSTRCGRIAFCTADGVTTESYCDSSPDAHGSEHHFVNGPPT